MEASSKRLVRQNHHHHYKSYSDVAPRRFSHQHTLLSTPFKPLTPIIAPASLLRDASPAYTYSRRRTSGTQRAITAASTSASGSSTPMSVDSDYSSCDEEISSSLSRSSDVSQRSGRQVLPLQSFYKVALQDLLLCPNESFFHAVFAHIFSRKVQAFIDHQIYNYDQLRQHFLHLRRTYYNRSSDGVLQFGPVLARSSNGERDGYLAAQLVMASLAETKDDHDMGYLHYDALVVTDTLEVSWVEGKDGESRRITRFDRRTQRLVKSP